MPREIFLFAVFAMLLGCAAQYKEARTYKPEMVQHIKGSVFKATDRGYYTTELVMKPNPPVVGDNKAQLIIHDYKATDMPGLDITVVPYLPAKNIVSAQKVKVYDAGRGLYLLENIGLAEPGTWQLKLTITGPIETDTVVLDLPDVK